MIFCYLDASAWVKRYYEEVGTARVEALFSGQAVLADEYRRGLTVSQLAGVFERQPSAVRSRLRRLGLLESAQE